MIVFRRNSSFFSSPNIRNCYWAGFIAADGYIRKDGKTLEISIHEKDRCLLEAFKTDLQYEGLLKHRKNLNQCRLIVKDRQIVNDLQSNFSIFNKKSLVLKPPRLGQINSLAFIKGYIDGDGSIYYNKQGNLKIKVVGTLKMLKWIRKTLKEVNKERIGKCKISKTSSIYEWALHGKNAVYFLNVFNKLDTYALARKWEKKEKERIFDVKNSTGGWIIGRFLKTVLTTDAFEVSYKRFKKGEKSDGHYHTKSTEYNMVVEGVVVVQHGKKRYYLGPGAGFIYYPNEQSQVEFTEDSALVVIRVPSVNDKEYPSDSDGGNSRLLSPGDYGSNSELHPK